MDALSTLICLQSIYCLAVSGEIMERYRDGHIGSYHLAIKDSERRTLDILADSKPFLLMSLVAE